MPALASVALVCAAFVEEGASVAGMEIDTAKCEALAAALPESIVVDGDATSLADNRHAVDAVVARHGGLDVLVHTVGVFDFHRGIKDLTDAELDAAFDEMFATNVRAQLYGVKAALPELEKTGGNVVLTGSTSSFYPARGGVLYLSSKFAVRGLVVALAHELAPRIRVNAVAPGGTVGTDLRGLVALGLHEQRLDDRAGRAEELVGRTPLGVALEPDDHAGSYVVSRLRSSAGNHGHLRSSRRRDRRQGMTTTQPKGNPVSERERLRMSEEEVQALLDECRRAQVGTLNPDGSVHLVPLAFMRFDGQLAFWTDPTSRKVRNLRRDPRITCLIETGGGFEEFRAVQITGRATVH